MKLRFRLIAALLFSAAFITAQIHLNPVPGDFPLSLWMEHKQVTQIPWSVSVGNAYFRSDLRQELQIGAVIRPADLEKSGETHELILFLRVMDGTTPITPIHEVASNGLPRFSASPTAGRGAFWTQIAIVRPGKYKLELALLDKATGHYNIRFEDVLVSGDGNDPLEQALRVFPRFEFVETVKAEDRARPPGIPWPPLSQGVNIGVPWGQLRSANLSGMDLGVSTDPGPSFVIDREKTMHLSVLTILSPPERALGSENYLSLFQNNLSNFLSAFTRLDVVHGTARLTGVDLTNGTLVLDGKDLKGVTREMLNDAINRDTHSVSVGALVGQADQGRFFRDVVRARIEEAEKETEGAEHVIIIVGARLDLPKGASMAPLSPSPDCNCRVIYIRFALRPNESDDMDSLLKAFKPRVFQPLDWQDFRRNFATIYAQLLR
jgi:hypothetical protein